MTWNFAMQAMDQIINSAAKTLYMAGGQMGCPIVFRGPNGAAARVGAQHSQDYAAWYSQVPGLKVIQPHTAADAKGLLKAAIRDPNPIIFLENEILYGQTFPVPKLDDFVLPIGKAKIARAGKDVTIVSFGIGMTYALKAAEALAGEGIEAEVIDLRTIRPMDIDAVIASVKKTNRCVTVEEGWPQSSVGSHISAELMQKAFDFLDAPVINITGKDVPMPYAANLEKLALPSVKEVVEAAKSVSYRELSVSSGLSRRTWDAAASMAEPAKRRATYADLEAVPAHLVAEIIDGELVTHPRPSPRHGVAANALSDELDESIPEGSWRTGRMDIHRRAGASSRPHVVVPDIAGWRRERLSELPDASYFETAPDWVCEVLSALDGAARQHSEMRIYAEAGVPHFWLIDPRLQLSKRSS